MASEEIFLQNIKMIFKTFLKYSIIELCLNAIIDSFNKNFKQVKNAEILHVGEIQVGQYFSKITDGYDGYFECRIERLYNYYDDETYRCKVWISFSGRGLSDGKEKQVNYNRTCIDLPVKGGFGFQFIP